MDKLCSLDLKSFGVLNGLINQAEGQQDTTKRAAFLESVKAVAKEVRDIVVLRCLCEMERKDHGNRDVFVATVAKAFGQTFTKECRDIILHTGWSLGGDQEPTFPKRSGEDAIGSGACGQPHRTFSFGRR